VCFAQDIADADAWGNVGMAKTLDWFGEVALMLDLSSDGTTDTWNVDVYGQIDFPDDSESETTIPQFRLERFVIDGQQDEQLVFDNFACTDLWIEISKNGSTDTLTINTALFARVLHPLGATG